MIIPYVRGVIHADKIQRDYRYRVSVQPLVNRTDAIKTNLNTRKIQMQVTAVARSCTHEDPANTAILMDGVFFAHIPPA